MKFKLSQFLSMIVFALYVFHQIPNIVNRKSVRFHLMCFFSIYTTHAVKEAHSKYEPNIHSLLLCKNDWTYRLLSINDVKYHLLVNKCYQKSFMLSLFNS